MKKFIIPILAVVLFVSCNNENRPENENKFSINPTSINAPDVGGDYTITLNALQAWTATSEESWIKVSPMNGEAGTAEVSIKLSANKETAESTGKVVFQSSDQTIELPVSRAGKAAPYLRIVSNQSFVSPKEGGNYTVQIESNIRWSASSDVGWVKVSKGVSQNNDIISLTVDAATKPETTHAKVTFAPYGEGQAAGEQYVLISRGGTDATSMTVDPANIDVPAEGGDYTIQVTSNAKWRARTSWDVDWIKINGSDQGEGSGSFGITVDPATSANKAIGIITIEEIRSDNFAPVSVQVTINREGLQNAVLGVSRTSFTVPPAGGQCTVEIHSKNPWQATASSKNISLSATSGRGDGVIIITVNPSIDNDAHIATVKITTTGSNIINESIIIKILQMSHNEFYGLSIGDDKRVFFANGNLQYQPASQRWQFAANQYDYIGKGNGDYILYSSTSFGSGWIDLFSWGTGNRPTEMSAFPSLFSTFYDWGNNTIRNEEAYTWRTLYDYEWNYLLTGRENAEALQAFATVNNTHGYMFLPDGGISSTFRFQPGTTDWETNTYSVAEWQQLEAAGCVFLPAAGQRQYDDKKQEFYVSYFNSLGQYWAATDKFSTPDLAYSLYFRLIDGEDAMGFITVFADNKTIGCSVRLVRDAK